MEGIHDLSTEIQRLLNENRSKFMTPGENRSASRAHYVRETLKNYFYQNTLNN